MHYFTSAALAASLILSAIPVMAQAQEHPAHHPPANPDSMVMPMNSQTGTSDTMNQMVESPLGISHSRIGSGTSWLPDDAPMYAWHFNPGSWSLMLHGVAFGTYDKQYGQRGDDQFNSTNWIMLMASRQLGGGALHLRGMFSAEPFTVGASGYPLLLQSGEAFKGQPLHDRQHPHDLFMELSALYERAVSRNLGISLYLAPVGEPASGPVAFPHRPSAENEAFAPLSHHWQDATHISFGVITAGVFSRTVKLEGSIFNGREPDEDRYNFDYRGRSLDSYAGRIFVNPSSHWSLSASYAFLKSPEELRPAESQDRITASALFSAPRGAAGDWSSALIYGANRHSGGHFQNSMTAESNLNLDGRNTLFARLNYVRKSAEDLVIPGFSPDQEFDVESVVLGYVRELASLGGASVGLGIQGSVARISEELSPTYGTRAPKGLAVFLRIRPGRMRMGSDMNHGDSMPGMQMGAAERDGDGRRSGGAR